MNHKDQAKVLDYIEIAKQDGATCVLGGSPYSGPGARGKQFVEPTIFTGVSNNLIANEQAQLVTDCEIEWTKVKLKNNKDLYLSSFYMPHRNLEDLKDIPKLVMVIKISMFKISSMFF